MLISPRLRESDAPSRIAKAVAVATAAFAFLPAVAQADTVTQGESLTPSSSTAARIISDTAAGGGQALKFFSNTSAARSVSAAEGSIKLAVRARGDQCSGAPQLYVYIDGTRRLSASVSSKTYVTYTADVAVTPGAHTIKASFSNDYRSSSCDRNLVVDEIALQASPTLTGTDAPVPAPTVTPDPTATPVPTATPAPTTTAPMPSTVLGERSFAEAGLATKPGAFYFGGFEGSPWATTMKATTPQRSQNLSLVSDLNAFSSKSLRVLYPKGSQSDAAEPTPGKGGTNWKVKLDSTGLNVGGKDQVYLRYHLRFQPNFQFVKGGKLPGMAGGTSNSGGDVPTGYDGWSGRLMWRTGGAVVNYMYLPTSETWGTDLAWNYGGTTRKFVPGKWHCVEMQYKMNTVGSSNGVARSWLDGALALEKTNLLYRKTAALKVDNFTFSTFFGGSGSEWASPSNQYIDYDNIVMSTERIGCA